MEARGEVLGAASLVSAFEAPKPALSQPSSAPIAVKSEPERPLDKTKPKIPAPGYNPADKKKEPLKGEVPVAIKGEAPKAEPEPKPAGDSMKANGWTVDPFKKP